MNQQYNRNPISSQGYNLNFGENSASNDPFADIEQNNTGFGMANFNTNL